MENVQFNIDATYNGEADVDRFIEQTKQIERNLDSLGRAGRGLTQVRSQVAQMTQAVARSNAGRAQSTRTVQEETVAIQAQTAAVQDLAEERLQEAAARRQQAAAVQAPPRQRREQSNVFQERARRLQQQQRAERTAARRTQAVLRRNLDILNNINNEIANGIRLRREAVQALRQRSAVRQGDQLLNPQASRPGGLVASASAQAEFLQRQVALNDTLVRQDSERVTLGERLGRAGLVADTARLRAAQALDRVTQRTGTTFRRLRVGARLFDRRITRAVGSLRRVREQTDGVNTSLREGNRRFRLFNGTVARSIISVTALAALFGVLQGISLGVGFADQLDRADNQIAGIVSSSAGLLDINGNVLSTTEGYAASLGIARDQVQGLRQDALRTASTFDELLDNFQIAVGPGLAAGLDLNQIRELTVQISQAATALGIGQEQLAEEVRSLFTGAINPRNSRIATVLGITPDDVRLARETGDLADFLTGRLEGISTAANDLQGTFQLVFSNLADQILQVAGVGFEPFRQQLLSVGAALGEAFTGDGAGVALIAQLGGFLADATGSLTRFIASLEPETLDRFFQGIRDVATALTDLGAGALSILIPTFANLAEIAGTLGGILERVSQAGNGFGGFLLSLGVATAALRAALLPLIGLIAGPLVAALRTAGLSLAAATGGLSLLTGLITLALGGFAAYSLAAERASDSVARTATETARLADALDRASRRTEAGGTSFLQVPIAQAEELQQAFQAAADQLENLQRRNRNGVTGVGVDSTFAPFTADPVDLVDVDLSQLDQLDARLVEVRRQGAAAAESIAGLDQAFRTAFVQRSQFEVFDERTSAADVQRSLRERANLRAIEQNAVEALVRAERAVVDSEEEAARITQQRIDLERRLGEETDRRNALQDAFLRENALATARQAQVDRRRLTAELAITQARVEAGNIEGNPTAQRALDLRIRGLEDEARLLEQRTTLEALAARAESLRNQGRGAAAALTGGLLLGIARQQFDLVNQQIAAERELADVQLERLQAQQRFRQENQVEGIAQTVEQDVAAQRNFDSRLDGTNVDEIATLQDLEASDRRRLDLATNQLALARTLGFSNEQLLTLEQARVQAANDLNARTRERISLEQRERERAEFGAGAGAGLRGQRQGNGEIAATFVGQSFDALRGGLRSTIAAAFDPNSNFDLGQGLRNIGASIGQAFLDAAIEAFIIQPLIGSLGAAFGIPGFNDGGAIEDRTRGGRVGPANLSRSPKGTHPKDRVLAALTPGEGVLNVGAMKALGTDWLNAVNRNYGAIQVGRAPKKAAPGAIQGFNSGGQVGDGRQRSLGRRPPISAGITPILVADRERARQILRSQAFEERTIKAQRTLNALRK